MTATVAAPPEPFAGWSEARGWAPHAHQLEMLTAARDRASALLIAPTGGGKALASFLPSLIERRAPGREKTRRQVTVNADLLDEAARSLVEDAMAVDGERRMLA